jgi:multiphosphoryl transfer protein
MSIHLSGLPAAPGTAVGPAWLLRRSQLDVARYAITDTAMELQRALLAIGDARVQLGMVRERALATLSAADAAILETHQLFLEDPDFLAAIQTKIEQQLLNAEAAVFDATEAYAAQLQWLDDERLRARAQDVRDVGLRVLACLRGEYGISLALDAPSVVLADDMTLADLLAFDRDKLLGLATVNSSPASHLALLARSMGVPAVMAVDLPMHAIAAGALVVVDGDNGWVILEPTAQELAAAPERGAAAKPPAAISADRQVAKTIDGFTIAVLTNVASSSEARLALNQGADGIGLLRTELLFAGRTSAPSEDEQAAAYHAVMRQFGSRPLTARTFDAGGDKPLRFFDTGSEPNPFLGWRGIRIMRDKPEVLLTQFRALLIARGGEPLRLMAPMVSTVDEVVFARALFDQAKRETGATPDAQFGIMIEVPAAALLAEQLMPHVDFVSIGTNDLTQYTLAADRSNPRVSSLASHFHPAVLQLVAMAAAAAHAHDKDVSVCGDVAADARAVPLLVGLGADALSVPPTAVPAIKGAVRRAEFDHCRELAAMCLTKASAQEVLDILAGSR